MPRNKQDKKSSEEPKNTGGESGMSEHEPSAMPPSANTEGGEMASSSPRDFSQEDLKVASSSGDAAPSINPPESNIQGITAWQNDKRINALWTKNQNRNAWVSITGVGWKKLANTSDSANVALNILGAHAKQTAARVDYRDEADGMIHEMYIW